MHLYKSNSLTGSALAIHVGDRLMVSPAVHKLLVMADDDREITQIVKKLDVVDIDKLKIPAFTKKEDCNASK
jgi:hypothetical protein